MLDITPYEPYDWFWIINNDISKAWSSSENKYVTEWDSTKSSHAKSELDVSNVLLQYKLDGPQILPVYIYNEMIRRQCLILNMTTPNESELQRRILAGTREATDLQNIKIKHLTDANANPDWTEAQSMWAAQLEYIEGELTKLEMFAEILYESLPLDYKDDKYWQ